jgi:hypothetical protein
MVGGNSYRYVDSAKDHGDVFVMQGNMDCHSHPPVMPRNICEVSAANKVENFVKRTHDEQLTDAALIVALRNNLPAIIEALRAQEWQPIETAPRDGTRFILASTVVHEQPVVWHFNAARNAWVNNRGHYRPADDMEPEVAPVWRPLPNPPAQEQGKP